MQDLINYEMGYCGNGVKKMFSSTAVAKLLFNAPFVYALNADGKAVVENKDSGDDMLMATGRAIDLDPTQSVEISKQGDSLLTYTDMENGKIVTLSTTPDSPEILDKESSTFDSTRGKWVSSNNSQMLVEWQNDSTLNLRSISSWAYAKISLTNTLKKDRRYVFEIEVLESNFRGRAKFTFQGGFPNIGGALIYNPPSVYLGNVGKYSIDFTHNGGWLQIEIRPTIPGLLTLKLGSASLREVLIPGLTKYTFINQKINNILVHETPWSTADKIAIDNNPNLIGKLSLNPAGSIAELDMTLNSNDAYYMCAEDGAMLHDARSANTSTITNFTTASRTTQEDMGVQTSAFELDGIGVPIAYTDTLIKVYGDGLITVPLTVPVVHPLLKDIANIEGDGTTATITYADTTTEVI